MQTIQFLLKEKNQLKLSADKKTETNLPNNTDLHKENIRKEKPYRDPIIPRSSRKDRLEIW